MTALNTDAAQTASRTRSDETLIRDTLNTRLVSAGQGIQFDYVDGVIVLQGQVPSFYIKQVAQECLRNLPSIDQVDNRLKVDRSMARTAP